MRLPRFCTLLLILLPFLIRAQTSVNPVDGPNSGPPVQTVYVYSGSNLAAICWSPSIITAAAPVTSNRNTTAVSVSGVSKASSAVVTSTGHGLTVGTRPLVIISGATGTGWTAINASWTATVIDANTFSVPIDSTLFGTLGGTVTFLTTAPRQTVAEWAVQLLNLSGTSLVSKTWLNGTNSYSTKCSDATSATANMQ